MDPIPAKVLSIIVTFKPNGDADIMSIKLTDTAPVAAPLAADAGVREVLAKALEAACYDRNNGNVFLRQADAAIAHLKSHGWGPKVEELRPEVLAFAHAMEAQLRANDHKPGWKSDTLDSLHRRLVEESKEVLDSINEEAPPNTIAKECADVANFAMMLADRCGGLKHGGVA